MRQTNRLKYNMSEAWVSFRPDRLSIVFFTTLIVLLPNVFLYFTTSGS
jgi:hypothetical protein